MKSIAFKVQSIVIGLILFPLLFSVGNTATLSVSSESKLIEALHTARPGDTILLQDGTYRIPPTTWPYRLPRKI